MQISKREQTIIKVLARLDIKVTNLHDLYQQWYIACKSRYNEVQPLYKELSK